MRVLPRKALFFALVIFSSLAFADVMPPDLIVYFSPSLSFSTNPFVFLLLAAFIWAGNFLIDLFLSFLLLRFIFSFFEWKKILLAGFIGSILGFGADVAALIFSAVFFSWQTPSPIFYKHVTNVNGFVYFFASFAILFLSYFLIGKFLLRLDRKADEIASHYASLERGGKKKPAKKPLSIAGYSLAWESFKPALFGLLMALLTNPAWIHLILNF